MEISELWSSKLCAYVCVLGMLVKMQVCVCMCACVCVCVLGLLVEMQTCQPPPAATVTQRVWGGGDRECLPSSSGDLTQVMELKAQPRG